MNDRLSLPPARADALVAQIAARSDLVTRQIDADRLLEAEGAAPKAAACGLGAATASAGTGQRTRSVESALRTVAASARPTLTCTWPGPPPPTASSAAPSSSSPASTHRTALRALAATSASRA